MFQIAYSQKSPAIVWKNGIKLNSTSTSKYATKIIATRSKLKFFQSGVTSKGIRREILEILSPSFRAQREGEI